MKFKSIIKVLIFIVLLIALSISDHTTEKSRGLLLLYTTSIALAYLFIPALLKQRSNLQGLADLKEFAEKRGWQYRETLTKSDKDFLQYLFSETSSNSATYDELSAIEGENESGKFVVYLPDLAGSINEVVMPFMTTVQSSAKKFPEMTLVSKKNHKTRAKPLYMTNSELVTTEGDFDKYFSVYAPKDSSREALSVLTPDLMQKLVNLSPNCIIKLHEHLVILENKKLSEQGLIEILGWSSQILQEIEDSFGGHKSSSDKFLKSGFWLPVRSNYLGSNNLMNSVAVVLLIIWIALMIYMSFKGYLT